MVLAGVVLWADVTPSWITAVSKNVNDRLLRRLGLALDGEMQFLGRSLRPFFVAVIHGTAPAPAIRSIREREILL